VARFAAAGNENETTANGSVSLSASGLPVVDLGYATHQASFYNTSNQYYNFSNIRYAAPPLGPLRFTAPEPPLWNRSAGVQNGLYGNICPQASPAWELIAEILLGAVPPNTTFSIPPPAPNESEDCLFLDVVVPKEVLNRAAQGYTGRGRGAPVLVWIFGGGYTSGSKSDSGNPATLLAQSRDIGSGQSTIYVALNYRLGAFGWLAGPTLQSNGTANAGLLDQRKALEWVRKYISIFGGDPSRVTVFGESAGGGSIMHHIVSKGGAGGPLPFQQAIPQSPGFVPVPSHYDQEVVFDSYLAAANVTDLQQLRQLPSSTLMLANSLVVAAAPYGEFVWGPVTDGFYVSDVPGKLLLQGSFHRDVKLMIGHNSNEGLLFTNPTVTNASQYDKLVEMYLTHASPAVLSYITNVLYPPVYNGSYGYTSAFTQASTTLSEFSFTCNCVFLARAFNNATYNYLFSIPPGIHGEDVGYTFDNGPNPLVSNVTIAHALQDYIVSFAETGIPGAKGLPTFPTYGPQGTVLNLGNTGITPAPDPANNPRCYWWQKALYF
jgi:carboxylesterase type B